MLSVGDLLHERYRVVCLLAQGGMGAVFEAKDERLGHSVAVKQTFFSDAYLQKAFEREAKLLARLNHRALPRVTDYFVDPKGHFLVMDFIAGKDLNQLLQRERNPVPVPLVLDWADELLDALEYLHGLTPPIIHRDIKPGNIKLTERGTVMLLDFGLAKGLQTHVGQTAVPSLKAFTGAYAPIEQVQGVSTDPRSDLFSLGATLYHFLTGELPPDVLQRGKALFAGRGDLLPTADAVNPAVPEAVARVVHQALALDRDHRPPSASFLRRMLREASSEYQNRVTAEDLRVSTDLLGLWAKQAREDGNSDKTTRLVGIEGATTAAARTGSQDIAEMTTVVGQAPPGRPTPSFENAAPVTVQNPATRFDAGQANPTVTAESSDETLQGKGPRFDPPPGQRPKGKTGESARPLFVDARTEATERKRLAVVGLVFAVTVGAVWGAYRFRPSPEPAKPKPVAAPLPSPPREGFTNRLGMEFVLIPAGRFVMGSNDNAAETPPREVTIAKPFFIGKFEVTQSQWKAVMGKNPSYWVGPDLPVESVSWNDTAIFLKKLNTEKDGYRYRLPTEAEWEYACRAGTTGDYSGDLKASAWYAESRGGNIRPVGKKRPNAFGLHDMHGNVAEWCEDWFHRNYDGAPVDGTAWTANPEQPFRIVRGGSWYESADRCRSAARNWTAPQTRGIYIGFRVVAEKSNQDVSPQRTQGTQGN